MPYRKLLALDSNTEKKGIKTRLSRFGVQDKKGDLLEHPSLHFFPLEALRHALRPITETTDMHKHTNRTWVIGYCITFSNGDVTF